MTSEESEVGARQFLSDAGEAFREDPLGVIKLVLIFGPMLFLAYVASILEWLYG